MSRDRQLLRIGWLVIMGLVALAYLNGVHAPFVYDDRIEVVGNSTIRDLGSLRAVLEYNVSRVLLILTYAWNFRSFGLDPFGYHVTSLIIHGLVVGIGIALAVRIGRLGNHPWPVRTALLVGAVWAIHPMGSEGVIYITGRSESLCALFVFAALAIWAEALLREEEKGSAARSLRILAIGVTLLSMGTKEVAVMTPFVLLAMEWLLGPKEQRVRWFWYLPFLAIITLGITGRALYAEHFIPREVERPLAVQLTTQAEVWLRYVGLWLLPIKQTLYHHVPDVVPLSLRGGIAWSGIAALGYSAYRWSRDRPMVAWALLSAALFLIPSSSVVALKESMAEHRAYTLGFYLFLAIAWSVPAQLGRRMVMTVGLVVPVLLTLTVGRTHVWNSEVNLWSEATEISPDVAEPWYGLGDAHRFLGDQDQAIKAYETAVAVDPTHLDSWNNMGISKAEKGDYVGARRAWRSALKVRRTYCKAHANLAFLAYQRGEVEDAIVEFRTTLVYCPENLVAHYGLGTVYADERRDPKKAVWHFETLLEIEPDFARADEIRKRLLEMTW
jgi:tetratricopeptide (TPR) repeat protein